MAEEALMTVAECRRIEAEQFEISRKMLSEQSAKIELGFNSLHRRLDEINEAREKFLVETAKDVTDLKVRLEIKLSEFSVVKTRQDGIAKEVEHLSTVQEANERRLKVLFDNQDKLPERLAQIRSSGKRSGGVFVPWKIVIYVSAAILTGAFGGHYVASRNPARIPDVESRPK